MREMSYSNAGNGGGQYSGKSHWPHRLSMVLGWSSIENIPKTLDICGAITPKKRPFLDLYSSQKKIEKSRRTPRKGPNGLFFINYFYLFVFLTRTI